MELIFEFAEDFGWKGPVPVIFSVSPDRNWSCRTLRTGIKRAERFGYLERLKISEVNIKDSKDDMNTPLNLKEGDINKTGLHIGLNLVDICGFSAVLIAKFCGAFPSKSESGS